MSAAGAAGATAVGGGALAGWEPVIGLEIHVQLKTRTKMFCRCENVWGEPVNTRTCPTCLAHPGTLPVPNGTAIAWTIRLGLALGCEIGERAVFARKNYFYPDLPKGYQISQYDLPLCTGGRVVVPRAGGDLEVGIVRAHLEEDAAKTIHVGGATGRIHGASSSLVDFNRGGTPLVEIVSEPDVRSAEDARAFLQHLRQLVVELGISDAEMEKGSLRCDANVSVRRAGETALRTKTELKNMNSFAFVARGIDAELARQVAIYEGGGEVVQETLHFDPQTGAISSLRSKEEAHDYRYFPEPDLVVVSAPAELVESVRAALPEAPGVRLRRLEQQYELPFASADVLNGSAALAALFEATVAAGAGPKVAANVLTNQFLATGAAPEAVVAGELAQLLGGRETIPRSVFDEAIGRVAEPGFSAAPYLAEAAVGGADELGPLVDEVLAANPAEVEAFRGGKEGLLGFFVGQVMKASKGKADPRAVNELVRERLGC